MVSRLIYRHGCSLLCSGVSVVCGAVKTDLVYSEATLINVSRGGCQGSHCTILGGINVLEYSIAQPCPAATIAKLS